MESAAASREQPDKCSSDEARRHKYNTVFQGQVNLKGKINRGTERIIHKYYILEQIWRSELNKPKSERHTDKLMTKKMKRYIENRWSRQHHYWIVTSIRLSKEPAEPAENQINKKQTSKNHLGIIRNNAFRKARKIKPVRSLKKLIYLQ